MARRRQRRRNKPLPTETVQVEIESLSHEGRGVARVDGKTLFVDGALPQERAEVQYTYQRGQFDEGRALKIENPHTDRVDPPCQHFSVCGGCSLQHLSCDAQIKHKQQILKEQLAHFAGTQPLTWLQPLQADTLGYRRKARLGVRYVSKKQKVLIGFREKYSNFLAEIDDCPVLVQEVSQLLIPLAEMIAQLEVKFHIPQIEVSCGDDQVCLIVRHLQAMSDADRQLWVDFAKQHEIIVYLQPKGPKTVHRIWPLEQEKAQISYNLAEYQLEMLAEPLDFTQVNAQINCKMIPLALGLLDLQKEDRVLDLFCGIGNFTLPIATQVSHVVGVEGVDEMVKRASNNALHNGLDNAHFYQADLAADITNLEWSKQSYNKILIDPARSGALEVIDNIIKIAPEKIVYVSCNPATLARDTGELVKAGYRLITAGVMDMFPHTTHVESIALFEK
ncbi:MAG: 23S rRNA (uracil(1939)-C(5))-methyltransferase RlmD [Enterobacterales bacterium]|nr:23S rRNA (uracil(1939)-C(5))-methyltransferase RlmD [Enterobacterales bacterium]